MRFGSQGCGTEMPEAGKKEVRSSKGLIFHKETIRRRRRSGSPNNTDAVVAGLCPDKG